jgi:hypothetical protein
MAAKAKKKTAANDEAAMMALWQKAMTPSKGHARLEPLVGTFATKTTFVMGPGLPPQSSEGTSVHRWVLGGRYLEQVYKGTSMGMPFEGIGFTGYDNVQKRYVGTWMDSFGTGIMDSIGIGNPTAKAMDFEGKSCGPDGKTVKFLCKVRIKDRDRHSYEMWTKGPDRKLFRMMLVEYQRKA